MLGALYSGGNRRRPQLVLGPLRLFGQRVQAAVDALGLELDVPGYAALFLHHAESTHGRHQRFLLLAKFKNLFVVEKRQIVVVGSISDSPDK